ncbi:GSCFA domain-containing protein [Roseibium sp.]|uniref:GSCFA domain-containing protein n=1 Tax=Roseibium sp. TaxID=1936156 RepID=UPI003A96DE96
MSAENPYRSLPDKAFWRRSVAGVPPATVDPVGEFRLRIDAKTRVATAGSCFAQHIARKLQQTGLNYYVSETGHPILPEDVREKNGYRLFSARYGNIYTARQLIQLMQRAYGQFEPVETVWRHPDGSYRDPFRPTVQPGGFISETELKKDRIQHLAAVRDMFETLDVFVFTLGLTECWRHKTDGAVFPLCPGVEGGDFDPKLHEFYNQTSDEVIADMAAFFQALRSVNRNAKVILTVSPVPLIATAEPGAHVLQATCYSKAVLRVAAEMLTKNFDHVHYFPSFEIITGAFNRGRYYGDDLRNVTEPGVEHAMRVFLSHAAGISSAEPERELAQTAASADDTFLTEAEAIVDVECDELYLEKAANR